MVFQQDESFKELITAIGQMIDARFETFEVNFRAEMQAEFGKVRQEMATKDDIKKIWEVMATKEDIREIRNEMATKDDIKRVEDKIDKRDKQYEERFEVIETELHISPRKN